MSRSELSETYEGVVASDPVGSEAGVPLEVEECTRAIGSEHTVDPAGVEPETSQPQLEIGDVVAPHHWRVEIEVTVAKAVAGLDQRSHSRSVQTTVFVKTPFGLEAAEADFSVTAKGALNYLGFLNRVSELQQASVQISNSLATGPSAGLVVFRHDSGSRVRPGGPA